MNLYFLDDGHNDDMHLFLEENSTCESFLAQPDIILKNLNRGNPHQFFEQNRSAMGTAQ